jgi:hypothetical protein
MGGWRQLRLQRQSEREWLLSRIAERPDLTLRAVVAELAERGTPASYGAVWRFFKHAGITFKKNSARQRTGSRRHRSPADPVEGVSGSDLPQALGIHRRDTGLRRGRLWAKTNMTRRHGRCSRGARLVAKVPQGRWRTLTLACAGAGSFWRRCVTTASPRPASSTGRSKRQLSRPCRAVLGSHLELWRCCRHG